MAEHAHRDRVLDLVYGEVDGIDARALRDELERCPECGPELAKLEGAKRLADALPLEPLPSATRAALVAAARVKANETVAALPADEQRAAASPREGWWDRTRRFLLGPQTAMAAVMLLVVAIGVMVVPTGGDAPLGATTMRPEPELTLAEEADLELEPEAVEPPGSQDRQDVVAQDRQDIVAQNRQERAVNVDAPRTERSVAEPRADAVARGQLSRTPTRSSASTPRDPAPHAALGDAVSVEAERSDDGRYEAQQGFVGRGARGAEPRPTLSVEPAPPPPMPDSLDGESRALAPTAEELAPRALHQSARSRSSAGDCRGSLRVYSDLFTRFPAYSELPRALVEAASCERQLGNLSQARTLLVRAEGYPSTQADARRELRRLSTAQQAQRRARSAPSQPASVDSNAAY